MGLLCPRRKLAPGPGPPPQHEPRNGGPPTIPFGRRWLVPSHQDWLDVSKQLCSHCILPLKSIDPQTPINTCLFGPADLTPAPADPAAPRRFCEVSPPKPGRPPRASPAPRERRDERREERREEAEGRRSGARGKWQFWQWEMALWENPVAIGYK